MDQETTADSAVAEATAPAATTEAGPKAVPVPRLPKLTLKHGGKDHPLLKYAFPAKPANFPIKVNGAEVEAACTSGRGKEYTYILISNTSFYVAGTLPVDAECTVEFPEGYKFDEALTARVSSYKPKKPKAESAPVDPSMIAPAAGEATAETPAEVPTEPVVEPAPEGQKAKRRGK